MTSPIKRRKIHLASDERWAEYDISDFLKQARLEYRVSQAEVAKRLNMNHVTIGGWENNTAWPATLARLGKWCGCFGLEVELAIKEKGGPIVYSRKL